MVVFPYVVWAISIVAVVATGLRDPNLVSRKVFYCTVDRAGLKLVLNLYTLICCISACVLDGMLYYIGKLFSVSDDHHSVHRYRPSP